jgi:hypothetical protein
MASLKEQLAFARAILRMIQGFSFSVTSWGRTPYHNSHLKPPGDPHSLHLEWIAVDVVLDPGEDLTWFLQAVHDEGLHYLVEADHIHIQSRPSVHQSPSPTITQPATAPEGGQAQGGIPLEGPGGPPIQTRKT